jgi:hypothetical protein
MRLILNLLDVAQFEFLARRIERRFCPDRVDIHPFIYLER